VKEEDIDLSILSFYEHVLKHKEICY